MIFNLLKRAKELFYDNSESGLEATEVQSAIDEVQSSIDDINTDLTQKAIKHTTGTFTTNAYGWITFPYGQLVVMAKLKDNAYDYNHLSLEPVMQPQGSVMTKTYFQSTYNTTATAKALSGNTSYDVEYWYFNIEYID